SLSKQFGKLVNLAVVTNVIPYIIALSALGVMMKMANVPQGTYRRNSIVATIAILYSTYALYASGFEAVMGGLLASSLPSLLGGSVASRCLQKPGPPGAGAAPPPGQPVRA